MRKFFKDLLGSSTGTSSKRVAALFTLVNLIAFAWVAAIKSDDYTVPEFMFDALAWVVGAGLGFTVMERMFDQGSNKYDAKRRENDDYRGGYRDWDYRNDYNDHRNDGGRDRNNAGQADNINNNQGTAGPPIEQEPE